MKSTQNYNSDLKKKSSSMASWIETGKIFKTEAAKEQQSWTCYPDPGQCPTAKEPAVYILGKIALEEAAFTFTHKPGMTFVFKYI